MSTKYRRRRHKRGLRLRRRGARSSCSEWRTGQKKRAKITHKRAGKRFERLVRSLPELRVEEAMVVRAVEKGGRGEEAEEEKRLGIWNMEHDMKKRPDSFSPANRSPDSGVGGTSRKFSSVSQECGSRRTIRKGLANLSSLRVQNGKSSKNLFALLF